MHRDIKPDNFVISYDGTVKLNDFNDVQLIYQNTTTNGPCLFRRNRWSPYYQSPEEAMELPLTPAVDIFALGGVIWYLLTNHRPFYKLQKPAAFVQIASGQLPITDAAEDNEDDPLVRGILQLLRECWSYDPSQRPLAMDVANQLTALLNESTIAL